MSNKNAPRERCLAMGLAFVLVLVGLSLGCAQKGGNAQDKDAAQLPVAKNASLDQGGNEPSDLAQQGSDTPQARRIRVAAHGETTRLELPLGREVEVDAQYKGALLVLSCSPAVQGSFEHDPLFETLVDTISYGRAQDSNRIEEFKLALKQRCRYSLSRLDAETLELSLQPQKQREREADQSSSSMQRLTDIEFYQPDAGGLKIVLSGEEKVKYKLRPGKDNELNLALPGTRIPTPQTKLYNLDKFKSPVKKALLSNSKSGGRLHLSMSQRIPVKIDSRGKDLILKIAAREYEESDKAKLDVEPSEKGEEGQAPQAQTEQSPPQRNQSIAQFQNTLGDGLIIPGMQEQYTGKPVSIDVQDAEVSHVLRLLSQVGDFNLVMDEGVGGTITLKLEKVPWDHVLDNVLRQKGLGMKKVGHRILRIAPIDKLRQEQQRNIQVRKSAKEAEQTKEDLAPLHREYIQVNYADAQSLQSQVEKFLSDRGSVSHDARTDQLIVEDTRQNLNKVKNVVNKLDRPEPQVLIEARIVYATDSFTESLGLQWGGGLEYQSEYQGEDYNQGVYGGSGEGIGVAASPAESGFAVNLPNEGTTTAGIGSYISKLTGSTLFTIDAKLQLGETEGQAKTISKPKVVTLNNQEAVVEQGTMVATQTESESGGTTTEYTEAVLNLTVTPQITPDNKLIMDIQISDDSPVEGSDDIEKRSIQTKLIVDNGNTVVLGGIQRLSETQSQDKVPGLGDLPIFGWLFKNRYTQQTKRELLVFIQPKII